MSFSSLRFLIFMLAVLALLAAVRSNDWRKKVLAASSCFFYAAWDWRYLGLLLFISVIDYVAALQIHRSEKPSVRKGWLWFSILSNLGMLAYFKYFNFFCDNLNQLRWLTGIELPLYQILLPAGISFYTFKTMSYTIDVYRREIAPCRTWIDYVTFVTFFPELIAGPIVRASVLLPQMDRSIRPEWSRLMIGGSIFLQGLIKKTLIADRLSEIVDPIFSKPHIFDSSTIWLGVIAYAIQIYCDFSGYSDMAIGTARMIGYDLPANFNMPYLSQSVTEFWRRWHITLSEWLRDYVYIPLGGNRKGPARAQYNLLATMLLGGLWHGASWNFVLWGGIHGLALVAQKAWSRQGWSLPAPIAWAVTQLVILTAWVPFRAATFADTRIIVGKMWGVSAAGAEWWPSWLWFCLAICLAGHVIGLAMERRGNLKPIAWKQWLGMSVDANPVSGDYAYWSGVTVSGMYMLMMGVAVVLLFSPVDTSPFIYFQF